MKSELKDLKEAGKYDAQIDYTFQLSYNNSKN